MTSLHARHALLPGGWQRDVRITIDAGRIAAVTPDAAPADGQPPAGVVIPGMCNAHSHAFQRALAGHTEKRSPDGQDNFWSWRERMYRLAAAIDAPRLTAIARQAYCEMVASGYTSVVEFHYLHSPPGRSAPDAMFESLLEAAADSGIRLTYVPVLYERGGFGDEPLTPAQARFQNDLAAFLAHYRRVRERADDTVQVAVGAHSLRAVSSASLAEIVALAEADDIPLHIHIAEQRREVEQSLAIRHRRPVRWLLQAHAVNARWCLVHATHIDHEEITALAGSGATVCLCPSTEANLGDGLFPLSAYLSQGGQIAIGSDSHISINPFEELRWLEYGQRLVREQRNVAAMDTRHSGHNLYARALEGGALAAGTATGRIAVGAAADLLVFDDQDPMLAGHGAGTLLDALVFSGLALPLERVMVNGTWQVVDGRHVQREQARAAFGAAVGGLAAALAELG